MVLKKTIFTRKLEKKEVTLTLIELPSLEKSYQITMRKSKASSKSIYMIMKRLDTLLMVVDILMCVTSMINGFVLL